MKRWIGKKIVPNCDSCYATECIILCRSKLKYGGLPKYIIGPHYKTSILSKSVWAAKGTIFLEKLSNLLNLCPACFEFNFER